MATFVVCTQCGRVQETIGIDQLPDPWRQASDELLCPHCCSSKDGALEDVLAEEVIYLAGSVPDDTLDEGFCEVCAGPCQGH